VACFRTRLTSKAVQHINTRHGPLGGTTIHHKFSTHTEQRNTEKMLTHINPPSYIQSQCSGGRIKYFPAQNSMFGHQRVTKCRWFAWPWTFNPVSVFVSDLMKTTALNGPGCVMDFRYHCLSSEAPVIYMSCSDGGIVTLKMVNQSDFTCLAETHVGWRAEFPFAVVSNESDSKGKVNTIQFEI
jgi:hypothetical protein